VDTGGEHRRWAAFPYPTVYQPSPSAVSKTKPVAGLFDKHDDGEGKQPHEIDGNELQAAIKRLKRKASGAIDEDEGEDNLFD
jgi:hypothetical protein